MSIHLARQISYNELIEKLEIEKEKNNVYETRLGDLILYCYTKHCVYNANWNQWNTQARGLIIDQRTQEIVATPFPKFFNPDSALQKVALNTTSLGLMIKYNCLSS